MSKSSAKVASTGEETVPELNAVTATEKSGEKTDKKVDLMYLGPSIVGAVRHSTVFKNGILPKKAQECVSEYPVMEQLFVEIAKAPDAIKELNKKQSALSAIYAQTAQKFKGGK